MGPIRAFMCLDEIYIMDLNDFFVNVRVIKTVDKLGVQETDIF